MYIFLDNDKHSLTYKSFCVRHGAVSYDGFDTFVEAFIFMRGLLRDNPDLDTILGHIAEAKAIAEGE